MRKIRILVVEDQPVVQEGLCAVLSEIPDIDIVTNVEDSLAGLKINRQLAIDIILLEPSTNGIEESDAIPLFLEGNSDSKVLVYSSQDDEASVFRAFKAGATGYVLKTSPVEELITAIREVHQGNYFLSPTLNPAMIEFYLENKEVDPYEFTDFEELTAREKQVFRLIVEGMKTEHIGEALCISPKTVAKHRSSIKKKLKLETPVDMTHYAIRIGLLQPESGPNG